MGYTFFTNQLRTLRKNAGYTQEDVSRLLNIQRQTYCNYENGTRMPPLEIIVALAELYHVSVDTLVHKSADPQSPVSSANQNTYETKFICEFSSLSESMQKEVLEFIRFKKQRSE